jgi:hypothetical protein
MTDRLTADTINSDALDQLYDRVTRAERAVRRAEGSESWMAKHLARQDSRVNGLTRDRNRWRNRAERAETELAQLHEGEEPGANPVFEPTPGQWIHQFNQATAAKRLEVVGQLLDTAWRAWACTMNLHEERIHDGRHAEMALNEVRDVVTDMEATTGARTWAGWLRDAMRRGPEHCLLCVTEQKTEPASDPAATEAAIARVRSLAALWAKRTDQLKRASQLVTAALNDEPLALAGLAAPGPAATQATDDPPVQCWHTEAGTPCDWDVCKQPERLAAGDYGTDPREQR